MRGRTLYITIGSGNTTLPGPFPGVEVPNPNVSSPLFSSVLAVHFSAHVEKITAGFTLTAADQRALRKGARLTLNNGHGDRMAIELVANFRDFVRSPVPGFVVSSNPFGLVVLGNQIFVADASLNRVRAVDIHTGATSTLARLANVPNTLPFGPETVEPVPDSIHHFGDQLLVTYLTGFPFGPGAAQVRAIDLTTGQNGPFITGLTAAIDVLPVRGAGQFLVLEFGGAGLEQPGRLLSFASPDADPTILLPCLITPTSMILDQARHALFITEIGTGNIIRLPFP